MPKFADTTWATINAAVVKSGLYDDAAALAAELCKATGEDVNPSHVAASIQRHAWDVARAARAAATPARKATPATPAPEAQYSAAESVIRAYTRKEINKATMLEMLAAVNGGENSADVARTHARKTRKAAAAVAPK